MSLFLRFVFNFSKGVVCFVFQQDKKRVEQGILTNYYKMANEKTMKGNIEEFAVQMKRLVNNKEQR
jgi:hypothetical protein